MKERYSRNRLYVSEREQNIVKDYKIFLAGAGLGSVIAECALRFGFETMTIADGDKVEESDLNSQGYTSEEIGMFKAECLSRRLLKINPNAHITFINDFINPENVDRILAEQDIAVNVLDFKDEVTFVFDKICKERNIPVLHPYNFGWAGFLTVVDSKGYQISELSDNPKGFEQKVADYVIGHGAFWHEPKDWLDKVVTQYKNEKGTLPPPQLSIASWIAAGLCTNAIFHLATGKPVNYFPKFYISSLIK
jgi:molybdopterin/thiamine biosynthesis adenylyltransferase